MRALASLTSQANMILLWDQYSYIQVLDDLRKCQYCLDLLVASLSRGIEVVCIFNKQMISKVDHLGVCLGISKQTLLDTVHTPTFFKFSLGENFLTVDNFLHLNNQPSTHQSVITRDPSKALLLTVQQDVPSTPNRHHSAINEEFSQHQKSSSSSSFPNGGSKIAGAIFFTSDTMYGFIAEWLAKLDFPRKYQNLHKNGAFYLWNELGKSSRKANK